MTRIVFLLVVAALALWQTATCLAVDAFPDRTVRLIVPFPPGGSAAGLARIVGDRLATAWGKTVVVDNRAGAAGKIGMEMGAKAPAEFAAMITDETARWSRIVKDADIEVE